MLKFTDERLYVQGIGTAIMTDPATGDVLYYTDKAQEGNVVTSADNGEINAGIGNTTAIMIPTNAQVNVSITAADYNEYIKAASAGASITIGAPVAVCQTITAEGTSLTIDTSDGTPVAGVGESKVVAYVQEVGAASPVATGGIAYEVDPLTGAISGFTATIGTTYLVTYYVSRANATLTTITSKMKGKVVRFVMQRPIYTNVDVSTNTGDIWGMYYDIIPRLQLMPDAAGMNGNQSSASTTAINGRALSYNDDVITTDCASACAPYGSPLAYHLVVPCDATSGIEGILGVLGGALSLNVGATYQLSPAVIVNGKLGYGVPASDFTYESSAASIATVGASTGLVTAVAVGDAEITVTYTDEGGTEYTDYINVEVKNA